jgi:hypothetical protein
MNVVWKRKGGTKMSGLNNVVDRDSGVDIFAGDLLVRQLKSGRVSLQQWMRRLSLLLLPVFLLSPFFISQAPAATLSVQLSGSGSVNSSPPGITCPGTCSHDFTSVTLYANPNDDSIFSGWGGACAGMETCALSLSGATIVTALFTPKSSPVHVSGSHYGALQKAYDSVAAGGVVMAVAQDQPGDLNLNRGISFTMKGGYDAGFSSNAGTVTELNGTVSLATGSMIVENIAIGQSVLAPTAAPSGIVATAGNGQVSLVWNSMPGATSYNIYYSNATGVTRATGTQVTGTSVVTGLTNGTPYYFVVTAVSANGESVESGQVIATPLGFSQADFAGTWNFIRFAAGPKVNTGDDAGWMRGNATVAADGTVTVNSILDNLGHTTPPPVGTFFWTINSEGIVTQSGESALDPGNHGVMAANKQIAVGNGSSGTTRVIYVIVKQVAGVTFSDADLTSKNFVYHQLNSGSDNAWQYATGSVDSLKRVTLTSVTPGELPLPNFTTLSLDSTGIMTQTDNGTAQGVMTPDKQTIFVTETDSNTYKLRIIQMTGQTFTQSDLAGFWRSHILVSSASAPFWEYDLDSVTNAGVLTHVATLDSSGNTIPSPGTPTLTLGTTGIITRSDKPAKHGQLSYNKDMAVMTDTKNTGLYSISIGLKQ